MSYLMQKSGLLESMEGVNTKWFEQIIDFQLGWSRWLVKFCLVSTKALIGLGSGRFKSWWIFSDPYLTWTAWSYDSSFWIMLSCKQAFHANWFHSHSKIKAKRTIDVFLTDKLHSKVSKINGNWSYLINLVVRVTWKVWLDLKISRLG